MTWHPRFLACARCHGVDPKAAEASRAQTKGKLERPIRSIRGNVWPRLRTVADLPDLHRRAAPWVATVAYARVPQTTGGPPASRRAADVAALTAGTADHQCALGELRPRRVQLDGYVRADGHAWRVPPEGVGQAVFVQRPRAGGLRVLPGGRRAGRTPPPRVPARGEDRGPSAGATGAVAPGAGPLAVRTPPVDRVAGGVAVARDLRRDGGRMSVPVVQDLCQRLQRSEVGRLADSRAEPAAAAQQAYTAALTDLLQAEADARQQRDITSRTQMAPLP